MTDEATWTEKFDRWWAEHSGMPQVIHLSVEDRRALDRVRDQLRAAFMAGAAAERAEHRLPPLADWTMKPDD